MIDCGVPRCGIQVTKYEILCRQHWVKLPTSLRGRVTSLHATERGSPRHRAYVLAVLKLARAM